MRYKLYMDEHKNLRRAIINTFKTFDVVENGFKPHTVVVNIGMSSGLSFKHIKVVESRLAFDSYYGLLMPEPKQHRKAVKIPTKRTPVL